MTSSYHLSNDTIGRHAGALERFDSVVMHARALKRAHSGKMMMYYRNIVQFIRADALEDPAQIGTTAEGAHA